MKKTELGKEKTAGQLLLERFRVTDVTTLDLGDGLVVEFKFPRSYGEFEMLINGINTLVQSEKDPIKARDKRALELLRSVITNITPTEIKALVDNCPGLVDGLMNYVTRSCGDIVSIIQWGRVDEEKKDSEPTDSEQV